MQHVRLGATGLKVSRLCLGTMTFGYQCDEATSFAILDRAAAGGITFMDTSDVYPLGGGLERAGRTEEIIGKWIKGKRQDWVVATKCFWPVGPQPFHAGNNRRHILEAIDNSLKRLGTDYVDLYQLHSFDPNVTIDETLGALDDVVRAGKVRYIGCSNYLAYQIARALGRSDAHGWARFVSSQPRYNLLYREIEREMLPLCAEEGVGVIPYNPIAGGMLSGKHDRAKSPSEGTRFGYSGRIGSCTGTATGRSRYSAPLMSWRVLRRKRIFRWRRLQLRGCWPIRLLPVRSSARASPSSWMPRWRRWM